MIRARTLAASRDRILDDDDLIARFNLGVDLTVNAPKVSSAPRDYRSAVGSGVEMKTKTKPKKPSPEKTAAKRPVPRR